MGEDVGLHLGCYGNAYARTPNLDRLASEGARYTHALSTCPVCAPARSTIVTGRYPWSLGTHHMRSNLVKPPRLFTHHLRDAGYFVNWHTKTDFNFKPIYPPEPDPFCDASQDWVDDLAAGRLNDRPTFLYYNSIVTHESTMWDRSHGGWDARTGREALLPSLPAEHRHDPAAAPVPPYMPDTPAVRQCIARYFDALSMQDAHMGRVLQALDRSGRAAETIVIYMSDHGRGLPREKRWCYEGGLHLPMIIRWPGRINAGSVCDDLVSWVDIAPSILHLAGVPIPSGFQGQAALGPAAPPARRVAFAGRDRMDEAFDHVRVARDERYHYIRNGFPSLPYAQRVMYMERIPAMQDLRRLHAEGKLSPDAARWMSPTKPAEELYEWQVDPHMLHNLVGEAQHEPALRRLRAALDEHLASVGDLGAAPEGDLVERGVVTDLLTEYRPRTQALPPEQRIGPELTIIERQAAVAWSQKCAAAASSSGQATH